METNPDVALRKARGAVDARRDASAQGPASGQRDSETLATTGGRPRRGSNEPLAAGGQVAHALTQAGVDDATRPAAHRPDRPTGPGRRAPPGQRVRSLPGTAGS